MASLGGSPPRFFLLSAALRLASLPFRQLLLSLPPSSDNFLLSLPPPSDASGRRVPQLWDPRSAQLFALENTKYYALLEVKDLTLKDGNKNGRSFRVIAVTVDRDKQGGSQTLPLFPHRDHMQQDIYFALVGGVSFSVVVLLSES